MQASQDGHLGVVKELVQHNPDMDLDQVTNVKLGEFLRPLHMLISIHTA